MSAASEFGHLDLFEARDETIDLFARAVAAEITDREPYGDAVTRISEGVLSRHEVAFGIHQAVELGLVKIEFGSTQWWVSRVPISGIDCGFPGCTNTVNDGPLWRANPRGQPGFFVCGAHPMGETRWAQDMDRRIEQMRDDPVAYVENARKAGGAR